MATTTNSLRSSFQEDKLTRPVSAYDNLNSKLRDDETKRNVRKSMEEDDVRRKNGGFPYTAITFTFDDDGKGQNGVSDNDRVVTKAAGESEGQESADVREPGSQMSAVEKSSQYVNISDAVLIDEKRRRDPKAIISSAKSKFLGLNGDDQGEDQLKKEDSIDKGVVPRRRIRLKMDDDEDSEEYGEETVKLLPEVINTFNTSTSSANGYQNVPRNNHNFQKQLSYVQEMKLVESSSSSESAARNDVIPRIKNSPRASSPDTADRHSQPSQAVYMATTVPQNMKPSQITGRHIPTRSSLRHSRMLVVNKNFKDHGKPNPLSLRHPKWGKFCFILQIIMGILAISIGFWLLLWAPSTRIQDNPYWSGVILVISGSIGCSLMNFKRAPRNKSREMCFRILKIKFSVCVVLAALAALLATLFAAVHLGALSASSTNCLPSNIFTVSSTCVCLFGRRNETTDHLEILRHTNGDAHEDGDMAVADTGGSEFHYKDLNCREVEGPFQYILMGSIATNLTGFVAAVTVLIMYWTGRRQRRRYVEATSSNPGVSQLPE
ncbi:hypothetical protein DMENIID0001_035250 [Sergentomyia squamirostris]